MRKSSHIKNKNLSFCYGIILFAFFVFSSGILSSQNIGVNNTGALPHASAMLDIVSADKGLLIPRVALISTVDVTTVPSPTTSLLVYNTNAGMTGGGLGFFFWNGTFWERLTSSSNANAWLLTGNAGTVDGTNFLGTTDNIPFNIRVNNQKAGRISQNGPTFFGYLSGNSNTGNNNTGFGFYALNANSSGNNNTALGWTALSANTTGEVNTAVGAALSANTTGNYNVAVGHAALGSNTTADRNTAVGVEALFFNTTGTQNVGMGYRALYANTTGNSNIAVGLSALSSNTTGINNTATGANALQDNRTGDQNTANGDRALWKNTTGSFNTAAGSLALGNNTTGTLNTANGYASLNNNTTGSNNTATGYNALTANTTGSLNTAMGYSAGVTSGTLTNATAIGANALVSASNALVLGSGVNVGIGTSTPNTSAILDMTSTNKGVLIPRIALSATNNNAPIGAGIATSLLVYNTATAGVAPNNVTPGYYYWDGAAWLRVVSSSTSSGTNWLLTGNSGTTDGTHFLGTTDGVPLTFRVNNQKAGRIETAGTTFFGYLAGNVNTGNMNTGIGSYALNLNTSGVRNTAIGDITLSKNTTGNDNNGVGRAALYNNTTGEQNNALGNNALYNNTTGDNNIAIGNDALSGNTTGFSNVGVGDHALFSNSTGYQNTALGDNAGYSFQGDGCVAVGHRALQSVTGDANTGVGYQCGNYMTSGSGKTLMGFQVLGVNNNMTTADNVTAIGSQASSTGNFTNISLLGGGATINANNKIRFGDAAVTVIEGQVAYSFPSDGRFKNDVVENVPGLEFIKKLRPVTYKFDTEKFDKFLNGDTKYTWKRDFTESKNIVHTGFIAQEVEKAAKECGFTFDGIHTPSNPTDNYSVAYSQFIMPLVKAVQEQQKMIETQQSEINSYKKMIENQNTKITALVNRLDILEKK